MLWIFPEDKEIDSVCFYGKYENEQPWCAYSIFLL